MAHPYPGPALAALASATLVAAAAAWEGAALDWYYCQLAERPYGRTVYVSEVFTPSPGVSEADVQAAFEDHVQRRYVGAPVAGALCLGPKASREEARRSRQNSLASLRRDGVAIVWTSWQFRNSREMSSPPRSPR